MFVFIILVFFYERQQSPLSPILHPHRSTYVLLPAISPQSQGTPQKLPIPARGEPPGRKRDKNHIQTRRICCRKGQALGEWGRGERPTDEQHCELLKVQGFREGEGGIEKNEGSSHLQSNSFGCPKQRHQEYKGSEIIYDQK
jgi:hypothetical protein